MTEYRMTEELEDPFGKDFNDLPLGRMAMKIQKDVEMIYRSQKKGSATFFTQMDPKDDLWQTDQFWLTETKEDKKQK